MTHAAPPQDTGRAPAARDWVQLARDVKAWGRELGFSAVGISDVDTSSAAPRLGEWLAQGRHGDMDYMERHAALRADPATLLPRAMRVICVRLDYLPDAATDWRASERRHVAGTETAVISIYARGRDYHKVLRDRLGTLVQRIEERIGAFGHRVCCDSAPVFEVEFARKAGLGWRGKHTLLLARDAGSMFFLGEILTDLPLPVDQPVTEHCGTCTSCIAACPTGAIVAPYQLDARRCISYLTIEHRGAIPEPLRPLIGNRIYGCDDCQRECPWNRFARVAAVPDFAIRNGLDGATLADLFAWSEEEFRRRHAGSAILRIGYGRWLRNIAVALGNGPPSQRALAALQARRDDPSALVREHVAWALRRLTAPQASGSMQSSASFDEGGGQASAGKTEMNDEENRRVPLPEAMRQATELHESGDLESAEAFYRAILDADPAHAGANYNLALIKLQTERAQEALPALKAALDRDPNQVTFWLNYAVALVGAGRAAEARDVLLDARGRGLGGEALAETLQKVDARLVADRQAASARHLDPRDQGELLSLYRERRLDEAQALAERLGARHPLVGLPWYVLGAIRMDVAQYEDAVPLLEKARDLEPGSVLVLQMLGLAYRRVERNEDARVVFEEALAMVPDSFDILLNASANAVTLGDAMAARGYADRAIALRPDSPDAVRVLADAVGAGGDAEEAARLYARLAEMNGLLPGA